MNARRGISNNFFKKNRTKSLHNTIDRSLSFNFLGIGRIEEKKAKHKIGKTKAKETKVKRIKRGRNRTTKDISGSTKAEEEAISRQIGKLVA